MIYRTRVVLIKGRSAWFSKEFQSQATLRSLDIAKLEYIEPVSQLKDVGNNTNNTYPGELL